MKENIEKNCHHIESKCYMKMKVKPNSDTPYQRIKNCIAETNDIVKKCTEENQKKLNNFFIENEVTLQERN